MGEGVGIATYFIAPSVQGWSLFPSPSNLGYTGTCFGQ